MPLARAAQELGKAVEEQAVRFRDACDQWTDHEQPPARATLEQIKEVANELGQALHVFSPTASERISTLLVHLDEVFERGNSQQVFEALIELAKAMQVFSGHAIEVILTGRQPDEFHEALHITRSACRELSDSMHQELGRLRTTINLATEQGQPCPELSGLEQMAGVLLMLGAQADGDELMKLAREQAWVHDVEAVANSLSRAEAWAYALTTHTPHLRKVEEGSGALPTGPQELTPVDQDTDAGLNTDTAPVASDPAHKPMSPGEHHIQEAAAGPIPAAHQDTDTGLDPGTGLGAIVPIQAMSPVEQDIPDLETYALRQAQHSATPPANQPLAESDSDPVERPHEPSVEIGLTHMIESLDRAEEEPVGVFYKEARQLMEAVGLMLPKWKDEPKLEASMAIRRAFHTLRLAATATQHHDIARLASAIEASLNDALSQIQGPSAQVRQGVIQAHAYLQDALRGDMGEWLDEGLYALETAKKKAVEKSATVARQEWAEIPAHSKELFHEFMATKWDILTRPEHQDFWMAMRVLETALRMVGADGYTIALGIAQEKRRMTLSARQCLNLLYQEHLNFHRGLTSERLLSLLEDNIRLAKQAWARKDAQALEQLLREQAQLLIEHGCLTKNS